MSTSRSPPRTRSKKGDGFDIDALVEAVVTRLQTPGVLGTAVAPSSASAPSSAPVSAGEPFGVATVKTEGGPDAEQRRLWLQELRAQLTSSPRFGVREKEEVRGLLIIGESGGPPAEHHSWFWGRIRLFLIIAFHGWGAAVDDARTSDMTRLGIQLSPAAAQPAAQPAAQGGVSAAAPQPGGRRGRTPSRPSGLRPPRGSRAAAP